MSKWIWEQTGWTNFRYDQAALRPLEDRFIHLGGIAVGTLRHLSPESHTSVMIHLFEEEGD
jgi:hypothetical protein